MLNYKIISALCLLVSFINPASSTSRTADDSEKNGSPAYCFYPKPPDNVTSYKSNIINATASRAYDYIAINVTCQDGYGLDGDGFFSCYLGKWAPSANLSRCVKPSCYLPPSTSVEYSCTVPEVGGARACGQFEPSGTVVRAQCRSPHYYSATDLPYMRCASGRWDYAPSCLPECGILTPDATQLMIGGKSAKRGEVPWHAGVYTKRRRPYEQICGGSLISNNIVLSAAHCFWEGRKLPADQFAVAVGKLYRPWDESHDDAQRSDVKEIHIKPHYRGHANYNPVDIAIVVVKDPFEYKNHIRPVCLDFSRIFQFRQLQPGAKGKVAGWGLLSENGQPSQVLKVIEMPFVEISKCIDEAPPLFQNYITPDKMCAGYKNGNKSLCLGDSGGGLSFPIQEKTTTRYYLRGIASVSSNERNVLCDASFYTTFTQILDHEDFIKQFWVADHALTNKNALIPSEDDLNIDRRLFQHLRFWIRKGNCVLPDYPAHGTYATHIPNGKPGEAYEFVAIHVTCDDGFQVDSKDESRDVYCFNGTWIPRPIPKCISADIQEPKRGKCILPQYPTHGTYVTNFPNVEPGDAVEYIFINITCEQGYGVESADRNREVYCYEGTWLPREMPKCTRLCRLPWHPSVQYRCLMSGSEDEFRDCKEFEPSGTVVSPACRDPHYYSTTDLPYMRCVGGSWDYIAKCLPECGTIEPEGPSQGNKVSIPWHALIYLKTLTPYKEICGGSVISHNTVLSAAHCFWNNFASRKEESSKYAVAVGHLYRSWGDRDGSQNSDVKSIHIPSVFQGPASNYDSDIAIVILATSIKFGLNVRPVCVDFHYNFDKRQLKQGNEGMAAYWIMDETGVDSKRTLLKPISFSYLDYATCIERSPPEFIAFITHDKMCAKYENAHGQPCAGEGGTGLVFPNLYKGTLRYYLRGIESAIPQIETADKLVPFTRLLRHEHFIKQYWIGLEVLYQYPGNIDSKSVNPDHTGFVTDLLPNKPVLHAGNSTSKLVMSRNSGFVDINVSSVILGLCFLMIRFY